MKSTAALLAVLVLAGCMDTSTSSDGTEGGDSAAPTQGPDILFGYVLDAAIAPIVGASVQIPGENLTAITNDMGYYGFKAAPSDRPLLIVTTAEGYKPSSKSITLVEDTRSVLNFTLNAIPVKEPYDEAQSFTGFIGCSSVIRTEDSRYEYECGSVSPQDDRVWEFNVNADLKSVVIEIAWESNNQLADHLNVTVETVGFGAFDEVLAYNEGESILRAQISQAQSERFYREGGTVRVSVDIGRNIEDEEVGVGSGVAVQQSFEVIASAFYVDPAPPGYTTA